MRTKPYQNYLEEEVLAANPLQLVQLLYRGALDSITAARRYLSLGEIRNRSNAISKAMAIVTELSRSLDPATKGELSQNLTELYSYVTTLLLDGNLQQSDAPLAEAESLLGTLLEAWDQCGDKDEMRVGHAATLPLRREPVSCAY
jgi:flagellar secretion chaperone FliS